MKIQDVHNAVDRVKRFAKVTPILRDDNLSLLLKRNVFLKLENLQTTRAFKIRGNANVIPLLSSVQRKHGLVTASTGNHGIGFSYISGKLHIDAIVVVPNMTPKTKVETIKKYGAKVIFYGKSYQEASEHAHKIAEKEGREYIGSFHSEGFFAGNATIVLEILKEIPNAEVIIAPIGGGGLMSGISFAAKELNPNIKIYGVQAKGCSSMYRSIKKGHPVTLKSSKTIADGVAVRRPSDLSFSYVSKYMDDMFLVSDEDIKDAITLLHNKSNLVVEGAGAASTAALIKYKNRIKGKNIIAIVTGGNIDTNFLLNILQDKII